MRASPDNERRNHITSTRPPFLLQFTTSHLPTLLVLGLSTSAPFVPVLSPLLRCVARRPDLPILNFYNTIPIARFLLHPAESRSPLTTPTSPPPHLHGRSEVFDYVCVCLCASLCLRSTLNFSPYTRRRRTLRLLVPPDLHPSENQPTGPASDSLSSTCESCFCAHDHCSAELSPGTLDDRLH